MAAAKLDPKRKAKRQKIMAAVLGVALLAVLAYEIPSLLKVMNKKPPPVTAAPVPIPVPGAATPAGTPVSTPVTGSTGGLPDSDPGAQAAGGQLASFDRFSTKDPFVQQLGAACDDDPTSPDTAKCTTGPRPPPESKPKPAPKTSASPPSTATAPTTAKISVNGTTEAVAVGQTFLQADPVFSLVSLTRTSAKVAISGGTLASGDLTVTLKKGKKVTLMNTADGTRYVLVLVSVL